MDLLEKHSGACFLNLVEMHGGDQKGVTNYFHALGAGHVTWLSRRHGNLWRFRNEGTYQNLPPFPPFGAVRKALFVFSRCTCSEQSTHTKGTQTRISCPHQNMPPKQRPKMGPKKNPGLSRAVCVLSACTVLSRTVYGTRTQTWLLAGRVSLPPLP